MNPGFSDKSVLVADNSPVIARLIKNYLARMGFAEENVWIVKDGNQASMMMGLKDFQLVTSGLHLPAKDGLELLKEIRGSSEEKTKSIPFVIISAERKEYYLQELEKAGCNGYLQKPFKIEQLEEIVTDIFFPGAREKAQPAREAAPEEAAPQAVPAIDFNPQIVGAFVESTVEALGQYMAQAVPGSPTAARDLSGDFSSVIDLTDANNAVKSQVILYFPRNAACKIYEGIFGAVDLEQVCGVVQELGNIIAGIVKPKISGLSPDIYRIVYPDRELSLADGGILSFQLGLPVAHMEDRHTVPLTDPNAPKFVVPFDVDKEKIFLVVQFLKHPS